MTRLGKILAVGALVAAPLAVTAATTAADAQVYFGVGPGYPYACSYYNPYYCGYGPYYGYGVGVGWGGWGWGGGWHGGHGGHAFAEHRHR
jgi:hypothetical protein